MHEGEEGRTLSAFTFGLREMAVAMDNDLPEVAGMYRALADLAEAVRSDLIEKEASR
jgi:hypothetical protein